MAKAIPSAPLFRILSTRGFTSYGFGVRTTLLGYYIKMDVAYPYEDLKKGSAKFYVTLGYDF